MSVHVVEGVAELANSEGSVLVGAGEQSSLDGARSPQAPVASVATMRDAFDRWSHQRDASEPWKRGVPLAEIPDEVHHYVDELSEHGEWRQSEEQAYAWYPTVSAGWAPYRQGRWGYTHYGYTWISYERWGWAPYHYGRWGYDHYGWHWVPGRHWGPAWVSFAIGPLMGRLEPTRLSQRSGLLLHVRPPLQEPLPQWAIWRIRELRPHRGRTQQKL